MKLITAIACLLVYSLSVSATAVRSDKSSETQTGRIVGTVADKLDAKIADAEIRVENGKFKWKGKTNAAGEFTATVPVGSYRVYVNANGFRKFESASIKVTPNDSEVLNVHLEVLMIIDTVTIKPKKKKP